MTLKKDRSTPLLKKKKKKKQGKKTLCVLIEKYLQDFFAWWEKRSQYSVYGLFPFVWSKGIVDILSSKLFFTDYCQITKYI